MEDLNKTHTVRILLGRSKREYEEWLNNLPDFNDLVLTPANFDSTLIDSYRLYKNLSLEGGKKLPPSTTKEDVLGWWKLGNENNFGYNAPVVFDGEE